MANYGNYTRGNQQPGYYPPPQQQYAPPPQQQQQQYAPPQQQQYAPPPQQQRQYAPPPSQQQQYAPPPQPQAGGYSYPSPQVQSPQHGSQQPKPGQLQPGQLQQPTAPQGGSLLSIVCDHCGTTNGYPPGSPSVICYVCKCETTLHRPFAIDETVMQLLNTNGISRIDAVDLLENNPVLYSNLIDSARSQPQQSQAHLPSHPTSPFPNSNPALDEVISSFKKISVSPPADPTLDPPDTPLSYQRIQLLVQHCSRISNYTPLYTRLQSAFSSRKVLNRSFLKVPEGKELTWESAATVKASSSTSGVDLKSLRATYQILYSLSTDCQRALAKGLGELLSEKSAFTLTEPEQLRCYLLVLECPIIHLVEYHFTVLYKLCCRLIKIPSKLTPVFLGWLASYGKDKDNHFYDWMITAIQNLITVRLKSKPPLYTDPIILAGIKSLGFFNVANTMDREIVPFQKFYNEALNRMIDSHNDYRIWTIRTAGFCYCQYPFVLDIASKSLLLKHEADAQMKDAHQDGLARRNVKNKYLELKIRRDLIIDTTIHQLLDKPYDLKKQLKIQFLGEEGIDAGGVKQEFFQLIIREIFNPKYGMFTYNKETNNFWFSPYPLESTQEYHLVGMIIGLAIYNGVILDLHFPPVIYKKLMAKPVVFSDLEDVDPSLYRGLKQLLDYDGDVEDVYCRTFEVSTEMFGETVTHPLKPGGKDLPLTNENRAEYIHLYAKYVLADSLEKQFASFRNGFMMLCGGNALSLLKPEELELLVCGNPEIDFKKLEAVSQYYGYTADSTTIRHFWDLVHSMKTEQKKKLLFFITGTNRVPFEGVGQISLNISRGHGSKTSLPTAHTCFNQIVIPNYQNRRLLEEKLIIAIDNAEGFGLK
mmetsp:Transcript_36081/g.49486  ORF Transcript_36081/g.49486 Transcript_36081/m.49486 type:complete len:873 (-) Transcript_36081:113-2731(-)|eukprot:CAMPEP_0201493134 /NCGR_PEP_ID=MMETSP0151_2-20130828/36228_1 /ASSEMBLY_ACC=CAM_ASM_000257 /TAXON_ID=200890 /ORGANISM="Paramoeba atlantica, Strain 621/1 / CCAP 1560/9" /LENGTH=872 /DNA_ID=CAMNT_0047880319 /DNA_START=167 /DNA_END=2785 /DNA_ORIENTATION=+